MKTFIFGKTLKDGEYYKLRQFLTQADVITSPYPLKNHPGCTVHLIGPYYLAEKWPEMEEFLLNNRQKMGINIMNMEWDCD